MVNNQSTAFVSTDRNFSSFSLFLLFGLEEEEGSSPEPELELGLELELELVCDDSWLLSVCELGLSLLVAGFGDLSSFACCCPYPYRILICECSGSANATAAPPVASIAATLR